MPKIKDPHHLKIELDGGRAKVSQPEYELSPEEWYRRRTEAFAQLRKFGWVPEELLQLIEHFEERTIVEPFVFRPGKEVSLRFGVKVLGEKSNKTERLAGVAAMSRQLHNENLDKDGMSASEALSFILRIELRALKHEEKLRRAAPVRALNHVPRSLISEIAMDLLGSCETWGYAPGPFLSSLLRELLNLEHDRQGMSRDAERQDQAAAVIAQAPTISTRALARALHVNASTISRWRRSHEFKKMVERKMTSCKKAPRAENVLQAFAKEGPLKEEALALLLSFLTQFYRRQL